MKNYKNSITNLVLLFIFLIPTTSHAEIDSLWAKSYHFCEDNQSNSLIETIDGGLLMTGNCGPGTGGEGYWDRDYMGMMVKMDQNGDTLWTKFIDLWDGYEGFTGKPLEVDDGGFLLNYNLRYDESHYSGPIFIRTNSISIAGLSDPYCVALDSSYIAQCINRGLNVKFARINMYYHRIYEHSGTVAKFNSWEKDYYQICKQYCSRSFYLNFRWNIWRKKYKWLPHFDLMVLPYRSIRVLLTKGPNSFIRKAKKRIFKEDRSDNVMDKSPEIIWDGTIN